MNLQRICGALVLSILLLAGPLTGQAGAVVISGDFDNDGDVDLADFAEFQTCILGPAIPQTEPLCTDARFDADEDVDLDDFEVFQGCLSGPDNPADPICACPTGQTSCNGTCAFGEQRYLLCGGVCRDTWVDPGACGGCGISCAGGQTCQGGVCQDQEPCWDCGGG